MGASWIEKTAVLFSDEERAAFCVRWLWERWHRDGERINSCAIITTEANELLQPVHDRMPVILRQQDYETWLDPEMHKAELLQGLLRPYDAEQMLAYPVGTLVNTPGRDDPAFIEPLTTGRNPA